MLLWAFVWRHTCENFVKQIFTGKLGSFCDTLTLLQQFLEGAFLHSVTYSNSCLWLSATVFVCEKLGYTVHQRWWHILISVNCQTKSLNKSRWNLLVPRSLVMPTKIWILKLAFKNWWSRWHWLGRKNLGGNAELVHHCRSPTMLQMLQQAPSHILLRGDRVESVVQCCDFEKPPWPFLFRSVTPSIHHNTTVQDSEVKNLVRASLQWTNVTRWIFVTPPI